MITVYTVICNGWDNLRPPLVPVDPNVRYICFTDLPMLASVEPWEIRPLYDLGVPARTARLPKILPHLLLPPDTTVSIYHDGNFQLIRSPHELASELLAEYDWAAHKHPARDCIYDEAQVLLKEKIGTPDLVAMETAVYQCEHYPTQAGLWANGFLVRRHTPRVADLNEAWWKRYAQGCERDQLSFPVARRDLHFPVNSIPENVYASPYMLFRWHAAWVAKEENVAFTRDRAELRARIDRLRALAPAVPAFPSF